MSAKDDMDEPRVNNILQRLADDSKLRPHEREDFGSILIDLLNQPLHFILNDIDTICTRIEEVAEDKEISVRVHFVQYIPIILLHLRKLQNQKLDHYLYDILIDVVLQYLKNEETQIRVKARQVLMQLLNDGIIDDQKLGEKILDILDSQDNNVEISSVLFMYYLAPIIGPKQTEDLFLPRFVQIAANTDSFIRKACVRFLPMLCNVLGPIASEKELLPIYMKLCNDSEWGVRKACAEEIPKISLLCTKKYRRDVLAPMATKLLNDSNRWVYTSAFEVLGVFIATFAEPGILGLSVNSEGGLFVTNAADEDFKQHSDEEKLRNLEYYEKMFAESLKNGASQMSSSSSTTLLSSSSSSPSTSPSSHQHGSATSGNNSNKKIGGSFLSIRNNSPAQSPRGEDVENPYIKFLSQSQLNFNYKYGSETTSSGGSSTSSSSSSASASTKYQNLSFNKNTSATEETTSNENFNDFNASTSRVNKYSDRHANLNFLTTTSSDLDLNTSSSSSSDFKIQDSIPAETSTPISTEAPVELPPPPPPSPAAATAAEKENIPIKVSSSSTNSTSSNSSSSSTGSGIIGGSDHPHLKRHTPEDLPSIIKLAIESKLEHDNKKSFFTQRRPDMKLFVKKQEIPPPETPSIENAPLEQLDFAAALKSSIGPQKMFNEVIIDKKDDDKNKPSLSDINLNLEKDVNKNDDSQLLDNYVKNEGNNEMLLGRDSMLPQRNEIEEIIDSLNLYKETDLKSTDDVGENSFNKNTIDKGTTEKSNNNVVDDDINSNIVNSSATVATITNVEGNSNPNDDDDDSKYNSHNYWYIKPDLPLDLDLVEGIKKSATDESSTSSMFSSSFSATSSSTVGMKAATEKGVTSTTTTPSTAVTSSSTIASAAQEIPTTTTTTTAINTPLSDEYLYEDFSDPSMEGWHLLFKDFTKTPRHIPMIRKDDIDRSLLKQDIVPADLLQFFLTMVHYPELDRNCAYNFPAVVLTLGRENWHMMCELLQSLCAAIPWEVRQIVVASIYQIALIIGRDYATRDLVPIFLSFFKDLDNVKIEALYNVTKFLQVIEPSRHVDIIAQLSECLEPENATNWRFREDLAKQVLSLIKMYETSANKECLMYLTGYALRLLMDKVHSVREVAFEALVVRARFCSDREIRYIINILIDEFAKCKHWRRRQIFSLLCYKWILEKAVDPQIFEIRILPLLFNLAKDSVPNVRLVVAKCLSKAVILHPYFRNPEHSQHNAIIEAIMTLQSDPDRDVREYALCELINNGKSLMEVTAEDSTLSNESNDSTIEGDTFILTEGNSSLETLIRIAGDNDNDNTAGSAAGGGDDGHANADGDRRKVEEVITDSSLEHTKEEDNANRDLLQTGLADQQLQQQQQQQESQ